MSTPFAILTGFLGSGKTTLLNRLLRHPGMDRTAVLVNEIGAIGLDHRLVEALADDIVLLESGCVCCSVRDDLGAALQSLLARRRANDIPYFGRIVLETTGIAAPGPIVQLLLDAPELAAQLRLDCVVTVVDAVLADESLDRYTECSEQVAMADRLILSKTDLATPERLANVLERVRNINCAATVLMSGERELDPADILAPMGSVACIAERVKALRGRNAGNGGGHSGRFRTFALCWDEPIAWSDFEAWLEGLLVVRGGDILRIKGLLNVAGRDLPVVIQGVQHTIYPPRELLRWPDGTPQTQLVFITRDFSRTAALRSLQPFIELQ